jgi:hypothetical protein
MFSYWSIAWDNSEETRPPSLQLGPGLLAGHVRSRDEKLLLMEDSLQLGLELLAGLLQVVYLLSMGLMYQGLFSSTILYMYSLCLVLQSVHIDLIASAAHVKGNWNSLRNFLYNVRGYWQPSENSSLDIGNF